MRILIDGDSCSRLNTTEQIAKKYKLECHIYCDTKRIIESDYSKVHIVDFGHDSTDFALANNCKCGDIVITNDSGLAALVLSRNAFALNCHGKEYTKNNIMTYLNSRHIRKNVSRKSNRKQVRGSLQYDNTPRPFGKVLVHIIKKHRKGALNETNSSI